MLFFPTSQNFYLAIYTSKQTQNWFTASDSSPLSGPPKQGDAIKENHGLDTFVYNNNNHSTSESVEISLSIRIKSLVSLLFEKLKLSLSLRLISDNSTQKSLNTRIDHINDQIKNVFINKKITHFYEYRRGSD